MYRLIFFVAGITVIPACSFNKYSDKCFRLERSSYFTFVSAQHVKITETKDCTLKVETTGAQSDQVQVVGVAVDAAVSAAMKGVKP